MFQLNSKYIMISIIILAIIGGIIYGIIYAVKSRSVSSVEATKYDPISLLGPNYPKQYTDVGATKPNDGNKYTVFISIKSGKRWYTPYAIIYNPTLGTDMTSAIAASKFDSEEAVRAFIATLYDPTNPNKAYAPISANSVEIDFPTYSNDIKIIFNTEQQLFLYN